VARRGLSPHAARALSGFVADHLLNALAQRTDLGPVVSDLRTALAARLQPAPVVEDDMVASVRQLHTSGGLDEDALLDAARAGDQRRMTVLLAVASAVPIDAVERAGTLRNAKALVSLVWKAGFTMHAAEIVQAVLGQLGPGAILLPAEDGFPLSVDEMRWQLEVLDQRGR
ncbi:MAG: DUF2336 domain-containing protein, partial [Gemmatimonadaceae bacterium]|nr:DUF2336 domain-containing protein [Acetobacteraceae bacterium]